MSVKQLKTNKLEYTVKLYLVKLTVKVYQINSVRNTRLHSISPVFSHSSEKQHENLFKKSFMPGQQLKMINYS